MTTVDLDLDVIRRRDGTVELIDVDEFAAHQIELDYPAELVDHAERLATTVLSAVNADEEPFSGVTAQTWMNQRRG